MNFQQIMKSAGNANNSPARATAAREARERVQAAAVSPELREMLRECDGAKHSGVSNEAAAYCLRAKYAKKHVDDVGVTWVNLTPAGRAKLGALE